MGVELLRLVAVLSIRAEQLPPLDEPQVPPMPRPKPRPKPRPPRPKGRLV